MKIYTEHMDKKLLCDHKEWHELLAEGWRFQGMTNNKAIMTRKGYINLFWSE